MDFWNMIYENVEKKHSFHNNIYIYIYIYWVTDISRFYEFLFCTYCIGLFSL